MGIKASVIQKRYVVDQTIEPVSPFNGLIWIYDDGTDYRQIIRVGGAWELLMARGPNAPGSGGTPGYAVEGSLWRNTSAGVLKEYDGAAWVAVSVTDHGGLGGLGDDDHSQYVNLSSAPTQHNNHFSYSTTGWKTVLSGLGGVDISGGMVMSDNLIFNGLRYTDSGAATTTLIAQNALADDQRVHSIPPLLDVDSIEIYFTPGSSYNGDISIFER